MNTVTSTAKGEHLSEIFGRANQVLRQVERDSPPEQQATGSEPREACTSESTPPLERLICTLGLSSIEADIVALLFSLEMNTEFQSRFAERTDTSKGEVTTQVLRRLLGHTPAMALDLQEALASNGKLIRNGVILARPANTTEAGVPSRNHLFLSERTTAFLLGSTAPDPALFRYIENLNETETEGSAIPLATEEIESLGRFLFVKGARRVAYVFGPEGAGHESAISAIAHAAGCKVLLLNTRRLLQQSIEVAERIIDGVARETRLLESALLIPDVELLLEPGHEMTREALLNSKNGIGVIFLAGSEPIDLKTFSSRGHAVQIELRAPEEKSRLVIWQRELAGRLKSDAGITPEELAQRYRFTPGQIETAANFATMEAIRRGAEDSLVRDDLITGCRLSSNRKLTELAKRIQVQFDWEDLVLSDATKDQVKGVVRSYRQQGPFFDGWGFGRRFQYGRGITALFGGASGTGKTMAASVIARELDLELYKIDLSRVISKYIGETEKNLSRLFREAETSNAILFFDEADALFGKRSEVKDAHDRHANIEIDFLLQQMEEYEGLTILATNLSQNIDEAFVRRLQFIINFAKPREAERLKIWKGMFPPEADVSPDVNFEILAANVELPGGSIKNIVFNAGMAALDENQPIGMDHLVRAIRIEYLKENIPFIAANFGVQPSR
jgi:AAA+ superfamily predicted ATPase